MKAFKVILTVIMGFVVSSVWAGQRNNTDFARVIEASPIYEQLAHTTPQTQCWNETVRYERPAYQRRSPTGTILGTMIGAAVGHNVAKSKRGQKVGRVAGAILGATIGSDVSHRNSSGSNRVEYREEQRCESKNYTEYEQVVVGYDVTYQYHGMTYQARMNEHPGDRVRVAVEVRPVY